MKKKVNDGGNHWWDLFIESAIPLVLFPSLPLRKFPIKSSDSGAEQDKDALVSDKADFLANISEEIYDDR